MSNAFQTETPNIEGNGALREPQKETYAALVDYAGEENPDEREVGIVLPVGCGKSGCITLAPFAFRSRRTLVIAPYLAIAKQLFDDFDPTNDGMFYKKCRVLSGSSFPEPAEIRGTKKTNEGDLEDADVVVTNIDQLQGGGENRWLKSLPSDFFDLIVFDEGHHSVAASYELLKGHFPEARIVNFSATPLRADGQRMAGRVLYSYPVYRAIEEGYVKRLKAIQLNPKTLRYVRREDGEEQEVDLDEVRRLGETDADFRRSIVSSEETLNAIVDASIRELDRLREETGEKRLKIIASALNFEHCHQVVAAYRACNRKVDYVHSKAKATNDKVLKQLDDHDLDVIVQVRKLGEGFDHPYLAVAAVFSVFANLSPFVQFVGRIMRVIEQNAPDSPLNQGVVVFHAGANVANRWADFQSFSEADQEYFQELLPLEGLDPEDVEKHREYTPRQPADGVEIRGQSDVRLEEIPLWDSNAEAKAAIELLKGLGVTTDDYENYRPLQPVHRTKQRQRQAKRQSLDPRIKTAAQAMLARHGLPHEGQTLDRQRRGRSNFVVTKSAIDRLIEAKYGKRDALKREQLDTINADFEDLVGQVEEELFGGTA